MKINRAAAQLFLNQCTYFKNTLCVIYILSPRRDWKDKEILSKIEHLPHVPRIAKRCKLSCDDSLTFSARHCNDARIHATPLYTKDKQNIKTKQTGFPMLVFVQHKQFISLLQP